MDSEIVSGPLAKKLKHASRWQSEWKRYNMNESRKGPSFVHCNICSTDFSVASGGLYDVKRHIDGKKHSEAARGMTSQSTLAETLAVCRRKDVLVLEEQVTTAEIYFSTFIAEHNMAFLAADHFTKLCKVMFPDSKIAE